MIRIFLATIFLLFSSTAFAGQKIAVLDFQGDGTEKVMLETITNKAREGVLAAVKNRLFNGKKLVVMTRENMLVMIKDNGLNPNCIEKADCEIEIGRAIGAEFVMTGKVNKVENNYHLSMALYETKNGAVEDLKSFETKEIQKAFPKIRTEAKQMILKGIAKSQENIKEGYLSQGNDWSASGANMVTIRFDSKPKSAVLMNDNKLCDSTPCTKSIEEGEHQFRFTKLRYKTKSITKVVKDDDEINVELEPNFGWFSVESNLKNIQLKVDGKPISLPIIQREIDPGIHHLQVQDPCYLPLSYRFQTKANEHKTDIPKLDIKHRKAGIQVSAQEGQNALSGIVYIDGKKTGRVGQVLTIPLCSKELTIQSNDGRKKSQKLILVENKLQQIGVTFHIENRVKVDRKNKELGPFNKNKERRSKDLAGNSNSDNENRPKKPQKASNIGIGNSIVGAIGMGLQVEGDTPRLQLSAFNLQFPVFRLEGLQYTKGLGASFFRPGLGFVLGSKDEEGFWVAPHYVFDWLNTTGEYRHVGGLELGHSPGLSLKLTADIPHTEEINEPRYGAQLYFSSLGAEEIVGNLVFNSYNNRFFHAAFSGIGGGIQWADGAPRFQLNTLNFQFQLLRIEGFQYTAGIGASFLRPGIGFVLGGSPRGDGLWISPHYVFDWLNSAGEKRHVAGLEFGYAPGFSLKLSADVPVNTKGDDERFGAQLYMSTLEGSESGDWFFPGQDRDFLQSSGGLIGAGVQVGGGTSRFLFSALNFQFPIFRLEGFQYTHGTDHSFSFLRPGFGFVLGSKEEEGFWVSPHYVFDWLNNSGKQRRLVGLEFGYSPGFSLKLSANMPATDTENNLEEMSIDSQIYVVPSGFQDFTWEFINNFVRDMFRSHMFGVSFDSLGMGTQFKDGEPMFQISAAHLQAPMIRLEMVQYTHGIGGSFIRPGLGFVIRPKQKRPGKTVMWLSPSYVYDWLNTYNEERHVLGIQLGSSIEDSIVGWSVKWTADFPYDLISEQPMHGIQLMFTGTVSAQ